MIDIDLGGRRRFSHEASAESLLKGCCVMELTGRIGSRNCYPVPMTTVEILFATPRRPLKLLRLRWQTRARSTAFAASASTARRSTLRVEYDATRLEAAAVCRSGSPGRPAGH